MKWTQNSVRFHFGWKSHFWVQSALYLCSHELRWNETQNGMDFISVKLTEMKFQTGIRFSCEHNLPETKWISADSLDVAFYAHVRLKLNAGIWISYRSLRQKWNFISSDTISCINTTWNEMPTHVHQNIGPFWNAVKMKLMWTELVFTAAWNLKPVWVHFASHVNVLVFKLYYWRNGN